MQLIDDGSLTVFQAEQLINNVEAALQNVYVLNAAGASLDLTQLLTLKNELTTYIANAGKP